MQEQLIGTTMPVLSISLDPGESVVAEAGEFSWMTDSIQMSTGMGGGVGGQGLIGALKRKIGGSSLLMSTYSAKGATGTIAFAAKLPGSIRPVNVTPGRESWCTGTDSWPGPRASRSAPASSSPSAQGSSRARASCCSASAARAGPGSSSPAS